MKKAIKSIALLILSALAFGGCEKDRWEENDLVLTDVFFITDITLTGGAANVSTDNASLNRLTAYCDEGELTVWENSSSVLRYVEIDKFTESSDDESYIFSFEELVNSELTLPSGDKVEATYRRVYSVVADTESGDGDMTVTEYDGAESTYSVSVSKETRTIEPTE